MGWFRYKVPGKNALATQMTVNFKAGTNARGRAVPEQQLGFGGWDFSHEAQLRPVCEVEGGYKLLLVAGSRTLHRHRENLPGEFANALTGNLRIYSHKSVQYFCSN